MHGEAYWRRSHQTEGARVCVNHGEVLLESPKTRGIGPQRRYICLEGIDDLVPLSIAGRIESHLALSAQVNSLFSMRLPHFNRYRFLLSVLPRLDAESLRPFRLAVALNYELTVRFGEEVFADLGLPLQTKVGGKLSRPNEGEYWGIPRPEMIPIFDLSQEPAPIHIYAMIAELLGKPLATVFKRTSREAGQHRGRHKSVPPKVAGSPHVHPDSIKPSSVAE